MIEKKVFLEKDIMLESNLIVASGQSYGKTLL
jgi:hypothetical protein